MQRSGLRPCATQGRPGDRPALFVGAGGFCAIVGAHDPRKRRLH